MAYFTEKMTSQFPSLSSAQQKVAHYILENIEEVVACSAKSIAEASSVSEATVHRLAQSLGYEGFSEMKLDIHQFVKNDHRAVNKFITTTTFQQESWLEKHFLQEADNVIQTGQGMDGVALREVAELFLQAEQIWIAGWRMGLSVTAFMQFVLKYMLGTSEMIPQGEAAEYANHFKEGDVLFVCSFPRYCQRTLKLAKIAKERNMKIVALTDNQLSPICEVADFVFYAKNKSGNFLDSYTAAVSICNAIVSEIAYIGKDKVMHNIQEMEQYFATFHE